MCLEHSKACENFVGYVGRVGVLLLGIVGIILSRIGSATCEFLSFENLEGVPWRELKPPFDTAIAANVGIFNYEILDSPNAADITDGCIPYEDKFFDLAENQEALVAAQICAVVAPVLAGCALLLNLMEACMCNFAGSFVFTSSLFIAAAGVQAGTFSMIAEPSLCFESESEQQCAQEPGTYLSVAAVLAFFFSSVLLCCFPRPDPFCCGIRDGRTRSTTKTTRTVVQTQEVPVNDSYGGDQAAPAPSPNKARSGDDENIDEEEFDESPPPPEGAQRVDVKEKSFPDGSREVTETTFFKDGSRSVRTIVHYPDGSKSEKTQVFD